MAASKDVMSELHTMLAEVMLEELRWYRDQNPPIPVPAADKSSIAKFLKDNDVTSDPLDASHVENLRKEFEEKAKARRPILDAAVEDVQALYPAH